MYPQAIFLGLTLYDILICVGIILCFLVFGKLADKRGLRAKFQNFCLGCGVLAITLGFGSAVLFQAIYNIAERGRFELTSDTGATFYGGLIGGVAVFLIAYFALGRIVFGSGELAGYHKKSFFAMASCAMPSIVIAHSFGRLGCLTAGCCHGAPCDAWYCIPMYGDAGFMKYVPTQLFEAVFLLLLFGVLFLNAKEGKRYNLSIYMAVYGFWRFVIEYMRADYRGSVGLSITPSQLIAVIMVVGAVGVYFLEKILSDKAKNTPEDEMEIVDGEEDVEVERKNDE